MSEMQHSTFLLCITLLGALTLISYKRQLFSFMDDYLISIDLLDHPNSPKREAAAAASVDATVVGIQRLPQIACVIYTYHGNRELIRESYETWGHQCDDFDAFSDEAWQYAPSTARGGGRSTTTIPLRTFPGHDSQLIADVRKIWHYLGDRYHNQTLHADFVTFSGDDAFWILPALRQYLSTFMTSSSSSTSPLRLLLGGVDKHHRHSNFPWVGGAGYVVSRRLLEERVMQQCPERWGREEDVFTSRCLYDHGVNFTDTRDKQGRPRFCREKPSEPCGYGGEDEPSDEVVLFHYTKGAVRRELARKYYGINVSSESLEPS